ncbi:helix-hairpin-helix domain-containing protein [Microbacterium koreense]|uniref:Helix-hairpin-helix domain-containing protein n=1 Tax=Microbacterium koreense TaxID=323761 RepID=A0ABW2ZSA1_9MICO
MTPGDPTSPRRRLGFGAAVVLVLGVLAVTVAIGVVRSATAPMEHVVYEATPASSPPASDNEVFVHVSGAVVNPGLYALERDQRVVDAIAAAGGFAPDAQEGGVNLARAVNDGELLVVPRVGEETIDAGGAGGVIADGRVNLNTADIAALETLPRIGPALAQRIVEWREANGGFRVVEDLLAVSGIGDKMFESLRELVFV